MFKGVNACMYVGEGLHRSFAIPDPFVSTNKICLHQKQALSPTEVRYATIEKEMLAIVWGFEKFHQYTYGRQVQVHSDHKPLEAIMKKMYM